MIKTRRQFKEKSIELAKWKQLNRQCVRTIKSYFGEAEERSAREINSTIEVLEGQLQDYKQLACNTSDLRSLRNAGQNLIRARLSLGWSQERLARESGLKRQSISRYEQELYAQASFNRTIQVANVLLEAIDKAEGVVD